MRFRIFRANCRNANEPEKMPKGVIFSLRALRSEFRTRSEAFYALFLMCENVVEILECLVLDLSDPFT